MRLFGIKFRFPQAVYEVKITDKEPEKVRIEWDGQLGNNCVCRMPSSLSETFIGREDFGTIPGAEKLAEKHVHIYHVTPEDPFHFLEGRQSFVMVALTSEVVEVDGIMLFPTESTWLKPGARVKLTDDITFIFDPIMP